MKKPKLSNIKNIFHTKIFNIESVEVEFSNKEKRSYQRLKPTGNGAVLIVPIIDDSVMMIYEYSVGTECYELSLPKGKIDANETILQAANRELQEEIGFGAKKLQHIKTMTLAPAYQANKTHIIMAQDLYHNTLEGDEPEPLKVVKHKLSNLHQLVYDKNLTEARSIAALYMVKDILTKCNK